MGVTLYTLVFGENPFYDVDETIKAELQLPFEVSAGKMPSFYLGLYFKSYLFVSFRLARPAGGHAPQESSVARLLVVPAAPPLAHAECRQQEVQVERSCASASPRFISR